jgi:hypothetical protein
MNNDLQQLIAEIDKLVAAHQRGAWDYVSVIAVVLTFIVLIWYTVETYRLRLAAVNQLAVATTPILMIAPVQGPKGAVPAIRNVGNGPALQYFHWGKRTGRQRHAYFLSFRYPGRKRGSDTPFRHSPSR